ncbi:MAG: hypothetical protein AABY93_03595 [Bacteroidota bacterium]
MNVALKIIKEVAPMVLLLLLGSCSKDNDPIPTPNDLIVGTWMVSTINATITVGAQSYVEYLKAQGLSDAEAQTLANELTDFFEDGASTVLDIKKGGMYSSTDAQGVIDTGTWELTADGNALTLDKGTSDETVFTVTTLSSANMNLMGDISNSSGGLTVKIRLEISLTK